MNRRRLKHLLQFNHREGFFTWLRPRSNRVRVGQRAGCLLPSGYVVIYLDGKSYREHHLVWLLYRGCFPKNYTDHRDGVRSNNRYENLREATKAQNNQNRGVQTNNTSGYPGVVLNRPGSWKARIKVDRKTYYLGVYGAPKLAHAAYLRAKKKLHKFQPVPRKNNG